VSSWGRPPKIGYNKHRMRIAISGYFLLHPTTGSGQYTAGLIRALGQACQDEIYVIAPRATAPLSRSLLAGRVAPWRVVPVSLPLQGDLGKLWFEQIGLPRASKAIRADLLHVPYLGPPIAKPCRTVVTVHDLIMLLLPETRRSPQARAYTWLASRATRGADFIMADSAATRDDIVRVLGIPADKIRVAHLACDETMYPVKDAGQLGAVRQKYGLEDEYVFYIGGLDWRKNLPLLLRAYAALPRKPQLAIAGRVFSQRRDSFPDLAGLAGSLGIRDRVAFLGQVPEEDKAPLYSGCAALVFPSLYEGFGLTPLEAMACGAPVVCSRASSLPEVVGDAALLFDPKDQEAVTEALARVLADGGLRTEMQRKGLNQARRFGWQQTAQETLAAYRQVVGGDAGLTRIWGNEGLSRWNTAVRRARQEVRGREGRALELGCGAGRFMRLLQPNNLGARFFGCDMDMKSLEAGHRQQDGACYTAADVHALPYQDNSFQTVLVFDVLEHLRQPDRTLSEVRRVLQPGGLLHALIPCEGQPGSLHWVLWRLHLGDDLKERHSGHIQRFTRRGALQLLRDAGFSIERVTYSMHPLGQVRDILSYIEQEDWFRRRRLNNVLFRGLWAAAYVESNALFTGLPVGAVALHVTARKGTSR